MQILATMLKVLAMAASFGGLCGALRRALGLDGFTAPLVTASAVMVALMLGGSVGILSAIWWMLYVGGFVALVWVLISDWRNLDWHAVLICMLALGYAAWLLGRAYYSENDTVSHWGMVVKYLLRLDVFPDASTQLIYYQSYPLGTAVFIYYFCRMTIQTEGAALVAQFMLCVFAMLPMLSLVRANKPLGWMLSLACMLFLLSYNTALTCLRVDSLLAFMGIGGTAIVARRWDTPRQAKAAALLVAAALVVVKGSGVFFSLLIVLFLCRAICLSEGKKGAVHTAILSAVVLLITFGLWELHVKLAYPVGMFSRHAVSLENYSVMLGEKDGELIRWIVVAMLKRLLHPARVDLALLGIGAALYVGLRLAIQARPQDRPVWLPRLRHTALACILVFAVWYVMMIGLYVFSMPADEARQLLSVQRYERTAIAYVVGLVTMLTTAYLCREELYLGVKGGVLALCGTVATMALLVFASLQGGVMARQLLQPGASKPEAFAGLLTLRENQEIAEEKRYLVFARHDVRPLNMSLYLTKYEFFSNDIMLIVGGIEREGYDKDAYYTFSNTYMHYTDVARVDDLTAVLAENINQYDYLLVLDPDENFEAVLSDFLPGYTGNAKVLRAY